uniref:Uncharacterized protein n=1 Tax=Heterorhabditis bacteriophora TaxID=37862 RepID=A0A1I7XEU3_HETBA
MLSLKCGIKVNIVLLKMKAPTTNYLTISFYLLFRQPLYTSPNLLLSEKVPRADARQNVNEQQVLFQFHVEQPAGLSVIIE